MPELQRDRLAAIVKSGQYWLLDKQVIDAQDVTTTPQRAVMVSTSYKEFDPDKRQRRDERGDALRRLGLSSG